jgi:membrane protein implicated in regulation of membrane protease activity
MCHLLLLLPVLALPVFWILPLAVAVPSYALVLVVSVAAYIGLVKAMRRPVLTGREHMLGATGEVIGGSGTTLRVQIDGELWSARSAQEALKPGDAVRVVAVEGLCLTVVPAHAV